MFDKHVFEHQTLQPQLANVPGWPVSSPLCLGYSGVATKIDKALNTILKLTLREQGACFRVAPRQQREIAVQRGEQVSIPNVFQLSTGETAVLNLFMSIVRDYDEADVTFTGLGEVRGIVVVDEIDAHMHADLQSSVLPKLVKLFPKVQFILTSHSPLFLLGLRRELTENGFVIMNLPECQEIGAERFSEFERAYDTLKDTAAHQRELAEAVSNSRKPVVFVEGDYDIRYLNKAAELLDRHAVLDRVSLIDGEGCGTLNGVWKNLDSKVGQTLAHQTILLYDCDVEKTKDEARGRAIKRRIPLTEENPIRKGIENLFPNSTIEKLRAANDRFIDVTPEVRKTVRGKEVVSPELLEANKDEKKNICTWLCENGTKEDFAGFTAVFDLLEAALNVGEK
ncbi:MAG: hypothetical protein FJ304_11100 [Planctomycetes bacterium]|nr:hypothetical protein [Planctomycetota bacterium]